MFNEKILAQIRERMTARDETLAVAESVTAGLLQCAIAQAKDASCFFQGGMIAYNLGQKTRHLDIEPIHAERCDCVSEKVSQQMALGVARHFCADWGIAVTGYAACTETVKRPFVFYAFSLSGKIVSSGKIESTQPEGWETQLYYVQELLQRFVERVT